MKFKKGQKILASFSTIFPYPSDPKNWKAGDESKTPLEYRNIKGVLVAPCTNDYKGPWRVMLENEYIERNMPIECLEIDLTNS